MPLADEVLCEECGRVVRELHFGRCERCDPSAPQQNDEQEDTTWRPEDEDERQHMLSVIRRAKVWCRGASDRARAPNIPECQQDKERVT